MNERKFNIVVLASGNGTNLGAIIDAKNEGKLQNLEILAVISDYENSGALDKARAYGAPPIFLSKEDKTKQQYDEKMLTKLQEIESDLGPIDLICLIGYMRIFTPEFIQNCPYKIINVHPSLLPKYGGKGMYGDHVHQAVLDAKDTHTGMTIHYVDEGVDTGEIILQKEVPVEPSDTIETLKQKVQAAEKIGYVEVLEKFSNNL